MLKRREDAVPNAATRTPTNPTPRAAECSPLDDVDTQLMLQARDGNQQAADELVRRNGARITRYVTRLVRDPRAAEDLTQDVFLQAFSRPEHYEPTARVLTWLYRVATNLALNYLKRASHRHEGPAAADVDVGVADPHEPPPDCRLSLDELKQQVAEALARLPANQRIALTLFEYEECSYEQIATVLDVTVEAVRSLLLRARTTLRRDLQGLL